MMEGREGYKGRKRYTDDDELGLRALMIAAALGMWVMGMTCVVMR